MTDTIKCFLRDNVGIPVMKYVFDERNAETMGKVVKTTVKVTTALSVGGYLYSMCYSSHALSRIALATLSGFHLAGWLSDASSRRYPGTAVGGPLLVYARDMMLGGGTAFVVQTAGEIFRKIIIINNT